MDLSEANQSCYNKDVENFGQSLEQKLVSNSVPVEASDKIDSKTINVDEMTVVSHQQQIDYLQRETESCKIVEDIWHSFNAFQRTITDVCDKDKLLNNASYDRTSVIVRSPNSSTFPINTTSKPISLMFESSTSCSSFNVSKKVSSVTPTIFNLANQTKLNSGNSASKTSTSSSFPTLSSTKPCISEFKTDCKNLLESNNSSPLTISSNSILKCTRDNVPSITNTFGTPRNLLLDTPDATTHVLIKHSDQDVKSSGIIYTQSSPSLDPSPYKTTASPKFEKNSILKLDKRQIHCEFFSEDNDWDIYQPGILTTESIPTTESATTHHNADATTHVLIEHSYHDAKSSGIIYTQYSPSMDPSPYRTTATPKFEKNSILKLDKRRIHCEFFSEDNDWDIYQPGIFTTESIPTTESSLESHFILSRKTEKCLPKNNLISVIDYDTCQRTSPYNQAATGSSPSSGSINKGSTFPDCNKDRMLKEVKAYFLENPIRVTENISDRERNKWIISEPYFSNSFALTHGLTPSNTTPIKEPNLLEELKKENEQIEGPELTNDLYETTRDYV